ncbi:general secretion pathway protein [Pollutimonas harenae]|uniref:General secretion pathway protein n=1 Tax=Pollutimonas harenae TaxID=657015 RepID=A0A853H0B0_9BURK|nr:general secretion pathway protein [Pollutimonas harenae]NYT85772.1 general secretion pathway protein [Pollutimonas harenae]TEA70837.1 general secretion pathway protein [Pollutimonas harenae]
MSHYSARRPVRVQWLQALLHRYDCQRFSAVRADYYDYLAALLQGMQQGRTLKEVFELDARRYGPHSVRGRLSSHWAQSYQMAGGDLYTTWLDSFPQNELGLLRAAQAFGGTVLLRTLAELSSALRLAEQARHILSSTLWAGVTALLMLFVMMLAVPGFTVPRLLNTFDAVPAEYHGRLTVLLLRFAGVIEAYWLFLAVLLLGGASLLLWSLPNTGGPLRRRLDRYAFWRLYRYIHALRFLSMLAILLMRDDVGSTQLKTVLSLQKMGASRWLDSYIDLMLDRIDLGIAGADTFDVNLLDQPHFWFLADMMTARGLYTGLMLGTERLRIHVLSATARQAAILRWCLLLGCLAGLLGLGLWHYAVIDELRRSLMLFYASQ